MVEGKWEWVGESKTANSEGVYGTTMGEASPGSFPGARFGIGWTTNSSFWLFGGNGYDIHGSRGENYL